MIKNTKIMGMLLLSSIMLTSVLISNIGFCKERVTVQWWYWKDISNPKSYWRLKVTYSDSTVKWYDGWCADQDNYLSRSGSADVWLYSSTEDDLPPDISNDEDWDVVNYIFNRWPTSDSSSPFKGATWKDIQQVVWIYTDAGYDPSASSYTPPEADDWGKVEEIRDHIDDLIAVDEIPTGGYLEAMILDMNNPICMAGPKQLLFFVIPEIAFGTLGAVATILGAYFTKMRLSRSKK